MMEEEDDEELERESVEAGIEPTISEVEVEDANQCATLSQTNLRQRNGTQRCFGRKNECGHFMGLIICQKICTWSLLPR